MFPAGVAKVLAAFLEDPAADRYGLDLMKVTDMASGMLLVVLPAAAALAGLLNERRSMAG